MYGKGREKSVNAVRSIMLRNMIGENDQLIMKFEPTYDQFRTKLGPIKD